MNTPHLGLMRTYGTTDVFFKKASGGPRLLDQVGHLVAGELLTKIARGPGMPGAMGALKPPPLHVKPPSFSSPTGLVHGGMKAPDLSHFSPQAADKLQAPTRPPVRSPLQSGIPNAPVSGGKQAPDLNQFSVQAADKPALGRLSAWEKGNRQSPTALASKVAPAAAPVATGAAKGGLPWNRMLLTGGMLGAGYLGLKGFQSGLEFMGGGHGGPANYGAAPGGYMPPMGVNAYGQPQLGTPLM